MAVAAEARGKMPTNDPVGAVPRDYNFAADMIERNLKAGRAGQPAIKNHPGPRS